jgi:hypothetical protein
MAKGDKVQFFSESTIYDDDEHSMKNKMINEFGLNGYNIITSFMEKLDKKSTLEAKENLLIL